MQNPILFFTKIRALRVVAFSLLLMLFVTSPGRAKGPLDADASYFCYHTISPILIKAKLCSSSQDCGEKRYFAFTAWNEIQFRMYGITEEKIIKEVFIAILNSGLKVNSFTVWRNKKNNRSFFERPILKYKRSFKE